MTGNRLFRQVAVAMIQPTSALVVLKRGGNTMAISISGVPFHARLTMPCVLARMSKSTWAPVKSSVQAAVSIKIRLALFAVSGRPRKVDRFFLLYDVGYLGF
jgi:hypothetical protein